MAKLDILTLGDGTTWHPDLPGPRHAHYCDHDRCGVLWVCFDAECHEGPARNCPRCAREAETVQELTDADRARFVTPYRDRVGDALQPGGIPVPDLGSPAEFDVEYTMQPKAPDDPETDLPPKRTRRKPGRATKGGD